MINGGIINFNGGTGGTGGSASGITSINSQTGPAISLSAADVSIVVSNPSPNVIAFSSSGFIEGVDTQLRDIIASSGQLGLSNTAASGQVILSQVVTSNAASGQAAINGDVEFGSLSGFIKIGDTNGASPLTFDIDVHALSGLWGLSPGGVGSITSVGVLGGADLTGDIDFTDPSGFVIWGDSAGASPITASIDVHALSGLWYLNQININKSNLDASGQIILNTLTVSGQTVLGIIASSGQELWSELKGSGQLILDRIAASGQLLVSNEDCDWNGFPDRDNCIISFDHSTREFSIQPTGAEFDYYIGCSQYLSTGDTLVISADEGIHYIYYDGPTLTEIVNPTEGDISVIIRTKALVSSVYWGTNQASGLYVGEERHGMSMSPVTHAYLHFSEGLRYITGLGLNNITTGGDGDADDYAVFGVDVGSVSDEDIYHVIGAVPSGEGLPVYYWTGSTPEWNKTDPSGFSVRTFDRTSNTRLAYNQYTGGAWQLTEVTNNDFVLCHVFATTEKDKPMIAIMGQNEYATQIAAQDGATLEIYNLILNNILLPEFRPIATLIFQTSNLYSNSVKARIVQTADGDSYIDWRNETISRVELTTSEHNNLNGLQGGASNEYYHLTQDEHDNVITLPGSGQVLLNELAVSGQVLLGSDAASGQVILTVLNVSGQVLLGDIASSGQVLLTEIGNISGITSEGMMVLNAAQSATISGQDVYIRAGAHIGAGSIHNRCRNTFFIGDQSSSPKDNEGTPYDIIQYARHGIYLRPDAYFVIGDATQGQWSPVDIFIYAGDNIKLFPSGAVEIGDSGFVDNTPDNIDFYSEDRFKTKVKNTYANNYEYGIDISSDNIALTTIPGQRPTINTSGIALLNEVLTSGQIVVASLGIIGDNDLKGDIDLQTKSSGFIGITRNGNVLQFNVDHPGLSGLWQLNRIVENAEDIKGSGQAILSDVVRSVGAQGGADIQQHVDFSDPSGFIIWGDTNGVSPVTASVDVHALSGLWNLGNIGTYQETISVAAATWTIVHGLNSKNLVVNLWDDSDFVINADSIKTDNLNQITINFTTAVAGRVEIVAINSNMPGGTGIDFATVSGIYKEAEAYIYLQGSAAGLNPTSGTDWTSLNLLSEGLFYRIKKNFTHINDTQNIYFGVSGVYAIMAALGTNFNVAAVQYGRISHYRIDIDSYDPVDSSLRYMQTSTQASNQILVNHMIRAQAGDFITFDGSFTASDPGSSYPPNQVGIWIVKVAEGDID